jgi:hypothetical protein
MFRLMPHLAAILEPKGAVARRQLRGHVEGVVEAHHSHFGNRRGEWE